MSDRKDLPKGYGGPPLSPLLRPRPPRPAAKQKPSARHEQLIRELPLTRTHGDAAEGCVEGVKVVLLGRRLVSCSVERDGVRMIINEYCGGVNIDDAGSRVEAAQIERLIAAGDVADVVKASIRFLAEEGRRKRKEPG